MKCLMVLSLLILILSIGSVFADQWPSNDPYINLHSILNPSRMKMNHTMSFMTGVSSGGKGFYQSVYTNHLFYQFHPKVDLKVDLNFVNYGTTKWDDTFSVKANNDNNSQVIPEFSLHYRPSDNTSIRIEFRSMGLHQRNDYWRW